VRLVFAVPVVVAACSLGLAACGGSRGTASSERLSDPNAVCAYEVRTGSLLLAGDGTDAAGLQAALVTNSTMLSLMRSSRQYADAVARKYILSSSPPDTSQYEAGLCRDAGNPLLTKSQRDAISIAGGTEMQKFLSIVDTFATPSPSPASLSTTASASTRPGQPTEFLQVIDCPDSHKGTERPTTLTVTCADGNESLTGLSWSSWAKAGATATGTLETNDCKPDCADGHQIRYPATVTLTDPLNVGDGTFMFQHLRLTVGGSYSSDFPQAENPYDEKLPTD
jgi:hypothetical protein